MILQEFKRCWKAKINLIMMVAMFLALASPYLDVQSQRNGQLRNIEAGVALGLDASDSVWTYEGMQGALFVWERLVAGFGGESILFLLVLFIMGAGIHVSGRLFSALETGYGTLLMTRMYYKTYLKQTLIAQFLYVMSFILLFFGLLFLTLLIVEGGSLHLTHLSGIGRHGDMAVWLYLLIQFGFILHIAISMGLMILLASVSFVFLKNRYIISFLPVGTLLGTFILAMLFFNINRLTYLLARFLTYQYSLQNLFTFFSVTNSGGSLLFVFANPLLLLLSFTLLYKLNVTKFGKDYV